MYNAIIVLANMMDEFGNLNDESLARLSHARDILCAGCAPLMVLSGWAYRNDTDLSIAEAMALHAVSSMGIKKEQIITDRCSRDTVGDAFFTKRNLFVPLKWREIIVVTSTYHACRTREIFSFIYGRPITVSAAPGASTRDHSSREARSLDAFRATFDGIEPGNDDEIFGRLRTRHPYYNGQIFPAIS